MTRNERLLFFVSLPERAVRALSAGIFGTVHETAHLLLPRLVRRSRLYEVTAKNLLRIAIELVGGVEATPSTAVAQPTARRTREKAPLRRRVRLHRRLRLLPSLLLAAASDILHGSQTYLRALEEELIRAGVLAEGAHFRSVDDLLGALEGSTGTTANLIDLPPLELRELRTSLAELRDDAASLPSPKELAQLFDGLVRTARLEGRSLLQVSSGVGLAFLSSARNVTRTHLVTPYGEDWQPLRNEGFGAYAARIAGPYRAAINVTLTPGAPPGPSASPAAWGAGANVPAGIAASKRSPSVNMTPRITPAPAHPAPSRAGGSDRCRCLSREPPPRSRPPG